MKAPTDGHEEYVAWLAHYYPTLALRRQRRRKPVAADGEAR